jgi:hypothetical protein
MSFLEILMPLFVLGICKQLRETGETSPDRLENVSSDDEEEYDRRMKKRRRRSRSYLDDEFLPRPIQPVSKIEINIAVGDFSKMANFCPKMRFLTKIFLIKFPFFSKNIIFHDSTTVPPLPRSGRSGYATGVCVGRSRLH